MFNVGGGEFLVIFLVALIVLGPAKLPEVARQVGHAVREVRRLSSGFQDEMRAAMQDPVEAAARERGRRIVSSDERPAPVDGDDPDGEDPAEPARPMSTAEAAGMYAVSPLDGTGPADAGPDPAPSDDPPPDGTAPADPTSPGDADAHDAADRDGGGAPDGSARPDGPTTDVS